MPDLDVIVKSLRRCSDMTICPSDCYYRKYAPDCIEKLHKDAIALLKEQNELLKEQEKVVLCKECKYFQEGIDIDGKPFTMCNCKKRKPTMTWGAEVSPDWFCGHAEIKGGEQDD